MEESKPKVILLVAGEGTRLRPYTLDRPKCMVKIDGISLIDRQLEVLQEAGLKDIVMIGGYKSEMLKKSGIKMKINPRYHKTNMVWTLFCAEDELEGDVIVSYGDIVYSKEILQVLLNSKADISVVIDKQWESYWRERNESPLDDAETLKLHEDGSIKEIGQKPNSLDEIEGQYIGLMKFNSNGLNLMKRVFHGGLLNNKLLDKSVENAYMTDLLQEMINTGEPVMPVFIEGGWIEIDTVSDLHLKSNLDRIKHKNEA